MVVVPRLVVRLLRFAHLRFSFALKAHFGAQLVQFLRVRNRIHQHLVQLFIGLQGAAQIVQLAAQIQQFTQRPDLPRHLLGLEIFHAAEIQVDFQIAGVRIFASLFSTRERQVRLHALEHAIEIFGSHIDKAAVFQSGQAAPSVDP